MWSCIWPPACSVVYCRRREDLVPTLTAPEPLHSIHTHQDKTGRGMHTACTLLQYFGKTLQCTSLFSSIYQRVCVCVCGSVCVHVCVHVCMRACVCELHSQMPSHDFLFVNPLLLLLPLVYPFPSLCSVTLDDCLAAKP